MEVVAVVTAAIALALAVGMIVHWSRTGHGLVKKTVIVHTKDDQTVKGILIAQRRDEWVLAEASLVSNEVEHMLGGHQHIPISNVSFAQQLFPKED